jgi:hypothetical protein
MQTSILNGPGGAPPQLTEEMDIDRDITYRQCLAWIPPQVLKELAVACAREDAPYLFSTLLDGGGMRNGARLVMMGIESNLVTWHVVFWPCCCDFQWPDGHICVAFSIV